MITLAAADTLAAGASVATQVTSTVFGMELNAGTEVYKVLDQRQLAAAPATIYTAPASTTAFIKTITVVNNDSVMRTAQYFRGGTAAANAITPPVSIPAGGWAVYEDGEGWDVYDGSGRLQSSVGPGRYLRTRVFTSGTSFVTSADVSTIVCRLVGGGAGGGGCTSVASAAAAAGGGGGGSEAEKTFSTGPSATVNYVIGAAGNGVSGAAGANATATTVTFGGVTVTAPGGTGGPVATATTALTARLGGAGGVLSTNGDVNGAGQAGAPGVILIVTGAIGVSGAGGSSMFGGGGNGIVAAGNGVNALGFGAGGGGALTGASAVRTGGNGTAGLLVVDEYT
jgi:hypothetical protein